MVLAGVVIAIIALVLMLLAPGAAIAHAALRDSSPGDGETVQEAPGELVLEFTGEMSFTVAALEQPSPTSQDRGESAETTDPSAVTAPTTTAPRAASTRSAGDPGSGGPPGWVWGVIAVAVLGLGGVAAVAYRSR